MSLARPLTVRFSPQTCQWECLRTAPEFVRTSFPNSTPRRAISLSKPASRSCSKEIPVLLSSAIVSTLSPILNWREKGGESGAMRESPGGRLQSRAGIQQASCSTTVNKNDRYLRRVAFWALFSRIDKGVASPTRSTGPKCGS